MKRSYYAIIPANVRYDKSLKPNSKLLYGEITALCNEMGYCWATNSYFAKLYEVSKDTVSRWINELAKRGYIKTEIIYKEGTSEIKNRYIYIAPIDEKVDRSIENDREGHDKKADTPIDEIVKGNNTLGLNITFNNKGVRDLFNHYLSKNIINHKKMTSAMRSAVNARLKDYSFEQLVQAIDNYATVYKGTGYFFTTRYGFADLMRDKDVRRFIDEADPLNNLKDSHSKISTKKINLEEFDLDD